MVGFVHDGRRARSLSVPKGQPSGRCGSHFRAGFPSGHGGGEAGADTLRAAVPGEGAKVAENGSAHHVGERVVVRYEVTDGRVTDVALDDASQAHVVVIVLAGLAVLVALFLNLVAWGRARD